MAISVAASKWPYRHKIPKDPDSVLDYQLDFSAWLGDGESITDADWTVDGGLVVEHSAFTATTATVWLSGGTLSDTRVTTIANATCRITTDSVPESRVDDHTLQLLIKAR